VSREVDRLADYLDHVLQAIDRIGRYVSSTDESAFMVNELIQDAVIRNLEVIGEASHNIETQFPEFSASRPELPLAFAYQMRNAVAHGYYKVDLAIVWRTITSDLLNFRVVVQAAAVELAATLRSNPSI
jgi:uncharacterized protein with HEPN domain